MTLLRLLKREARRYLGNRGPGSRTLFHCAQLITGAYKNDITDMTRNGEMWLQNELLPPRFVAFDVGANVGEWVLPLVRRDSTFTVYCFEPVRSTYQVLEKNISDKRVKLYNLALSASPGTVSMNECVADTHVSSFYDFTQWNDDLPAQKAVVTCVTGDDMLTRIGIPKLDFLKVDVEGHDFEVLLGFAKSLENERIDVIQFEYNYFTLLGGRSLRDFFALLEAHRFELFRLLPNRLEACRYDYSIEDFRQSNWVAIHGRMLTEKRRRSLNIVHSSHLGQK